MAIRDIKFQKAFQSILAYKGLKQADICRLSGIPSSQISYYFNGTRVPSLEVARILANVLGVTVDELSGHVNESISPNVKESVVISSITDLTPAGRRIGRAYDRADPPVQRTVEVALEPYMEDQENKEKPYNADKFETAAEPYVETKLYLRDIAMFSLPASAGTGVFLDGDDYDVVQVGSEVPATASFGVRISGDSMEPKYPDGHIAWVRMTPSVDVGQVGVFVLDGEGYIKKQGQGELISLNPVYSPIDLSRYENIRTCGLVVAVTPNEY